MCDFCGRDRKQKKTMYIVWNKKKLVCPKCWKKYKKEQKEEKKDS